VSTPVPPPTVPPRVPYGTLYTIKQTHSETQQQCKQVPLARGTNLPQAHISRLVFSDPLLYFFHLTLLLLGRLRSRARNSAAHDNSAHPARPALGMALMVDYLDFPDGCGKITCAVEIKRSRSHSPGRMSKLHPHFLIQ
jgi:hypothetical protein